MRVKLDILVLIGVGLLNLAICSALLLGPPCDQTTECFDNAKCDTNISACVCDDFFVMSVDWTKCLPVAAIPYISTCEETNQCSPRMGQGADCSEGKCVCKEGFHYLHGICYRSSGYGDYCNDDDECYGAFNYESMSCVDNKCVCSENYYLVGSSYCRRKGNVGEECVFDMDCQYDGGLCVGNICAPKNKEDQNVLSFTGTSEFQSPADLSTEFRAVNLSEACETSDECSAATDNSECFGKVCVCKPRYSEFGDSCRPDLGEFCSKADNVSYIQNAECRDSLIRCKAPNIIAVNNRECKFGREYGSQCQAPEQCMYSGDHAVCVESGIRNLCRCAAGYHFVDEIKLCVQTEGIGQPCDQSYECVVPSGKVQCTDGACVCLEGFHATRDDCVQDVKALNDPCVDITDCTRAITNSECVNSICQCSLGYFADLTTNISCLTGIGGACTDDSECSAVNSAFCNVTVCACDNSTIPSAGKDKCLNGTAGFGDKCEEVTQCYEKLGSKGSACVEGTCTCTEDYHFRNELCREKRVLGEVCEQNSQCYLESNEMDKVECRNGICQCGYAYTQTQDLDCKSGVSGQSASFEFVVGALMGVLLGQTKWN